MRLREGREFFEGTENPKGKSAATVNEIRSSRLERIVGSGSESQKDVKRRKEAA